MKAACQPELRLTSPAQHQAIAGRNSTLQKPLPGGTYRRRAGQSRGLHESIRSRIKSSHIGNHCGAQRGALLLDPLGRIAGYEKKLGCRAIELGLWNLYAAGLGGPVGCTDHDAAPQRSPESAMQCCRHILARWEIGIHARSFQPDVERVVIGSTLVVEPGALHKVEVAR